MPKGQWAKKQADGVLMIDDVVEEVAATLGEDDEDVETLRDLLKEIEDPTDRMQDLLYDLDRS